MSVVGIDFGNQNCVIAIARKGVVEVIVNEVSNRRTPSIVAFDGQERQLGESAAIRMVSNASNTVDNIKRMLGKHFSDPDFQNDRNLFHFQTKEMPDDRIGVEVNYMEGTTTFTPEQLAGSLFGCLKRITQKALAPQSVQDCVISIPSYFTDVQRRAVLDAAGIAGFNVLRLMHETSAVALQYGILRSLPETEPIKVLFVDIGHSASNCSVVSFVQGKLTVLGTSTDPNLGGRDFDAVLMRRFIEEISTSHRLDVTKNSKAMLRLAQNAERTKKMLSANHEAPWNVECIMNDVDVRGMVTRAEFETISTSLLERILVPIKNLMHELNLKPADLHSVELVGGCIRIPAVRVSIESWFGRQCSTTCDGDESVARGGALMCAMLSPSFKVRDFDVQDVTPFGIEVAYGPVDGPIGDFTPLFPKFNSIPVTKMINFFRAEPFQIQARYCDPCPLGDRMVGKFQITGIPQPVDPTKPVKSKIKVRLDLNGVISVPGAHSIQEDVSSEATGPVAQEIVSDAMPVDSSLPDGPVTQDDTSQAEDGSAPAESAEKKMDVDAPKKKPLKRTDLTIVSQFSGGLSSEAFQSMFEREVQMQNEDKVLAETAEKRNDLESYIYEMRDKASMDLAEFFSDSGRESFLAKLDEAESWLYSEESEGAQKSVFVAQLDALRAIGQPAVKRQAECVSRVLRVECANALINSYKEFVGSQDEQYAHIDVAKRAAVANKCKEVEEWLKSLQEKQERMSKFEDPVLTVAEIESKCKELAQFSDPIVRTPKPAPTPAPAEARKTPDGEAATEMRDEDPVQANEEVSKKDSDPAVPVQPEEFMNVD